MSANTSTAPPARTQRGLAVCVWAIPSKPPGKASALTSEIGTPDATLALSTALSDANRTDEQVVLRGGCSPYPTKQWQQQLHPSQQLLSKIEKKKSKATFCFTHSNVARDAFVCCNCRVRENSVPVPARMERRGNLAANGVAELERLLCAVQV